MTRRQTRRPVIRKLAMSSTLFGAAMVLCAGVALLCLLSACGPTVHYAVVYTGAPGASECVRECQGNYNDCVPSGRGGCSKQQYSCFQTCPGTVVNTKGCDAAGIVGPCAQYHEGSIN